MLNRRTLFTSAGSVALLATAAGCGLSAENSQDSSTGNPPPATLTGEITFQTWSLKNEKFTPYFEKLIKDFEAKHFGTKIKWLDQPGEGYEEKVLQQANAGSLPDVVNLPPHFAFQLARAGKLADLKKAAPDSQKLFVPGGLQAYTYEDIEGTYGFPWYLGTDMNFFNTKVLKEYGVNVPTNWDEMVKAALELAKKSNGKIPLISNLPGLDAFAAEGVTVMTEGKFTFNQAAAAKLLQQYADLYKAKAMPPEVLQNNYTGNAALYKQGKVAWTTGTASMISDLKKEAPTLVPVTETSKRFGTPPLFVQGLSVSKDSKNHHLAMEFAKFASNNENQVAFVKLAQGFMPGTAEGNANPAQFTGAIDDKNMAAAVKIAASQMPQAQQLSPVQYTEDMSIYTGQQLALALRGDISPQAALDKAVAYCNKKLK